MIQRLLAMAIAAVTIIGCGVFGGGTTAPNAWELADVSADGTELLVTTSFGGIASGCSRFDGWSVTETADEVEVLATL